MDIARRSTGSFDCVPHRRRTTCGTPLTMTARVTPAVS